jgi:hypothetical protein
MMPEDCSGREKEGNSMIRGDLFLRLDMEVKKSGLRCGLHKQGICRFASCPCEAHGNSAEADRLYAEKFLTHRTPSRHREHQP